MGTGEGATLVDRLRPPHSLLSRITPGWVVTIALIASSCFLLVGARDLWFFGDEWAFIVDRRELWASGERLAYLFRPHNEHLSTIPVVFHSAIFSLFGLRSYYAYLVPVIAAHVVVCVLLYRVTLRCVSDRWSAAAVACVFAFFGSGAENLTWGFQIGFVGATALGLGQLLAADHSGRTSWRDVGGAALGCLGVLTAGVAITMVAIVGLLMLMRRRWVGAAIQVVPAALLYGIWYVGVDAAEATSFRTDAGQIPPYVSVGLSATLDAIVQLPPAGMSVGIVLLLAAGALRLGAIDRIYPALALAAGTIIFFSINAYGRVALGVDQARASRYLYVAGLLLLPLVALGLAALRQQGRRSLCLVVALMVGWSVLGNVAAFYAVRGGRLTLIDPARERIEAAALYAGSTDVDANIVPEPTYSAPLTMAVLGALLESGDFVAPDPADVSPTARRQAGVDFGMVVADGTVPSDDVTAREVLDGSYAVAPNECVQISPDGPRPRVLLEPGDRGVISVTTSGTVTAVVESEGEEARREILAADSGPRQIVIDVVGGSPSLEFSPASPTLICGLTVDS